MGSPREPTEKPFGVANVGRFTEHIVVEHHDRVGHEYGAPRTFGERARRSAELLEDDALEVGER